MQKVIYNNPKFNTTVFKTIIESYGAEFKGEGEYNLSIISNNKFRLYLENDLYLARIDGKVVNHIEFIKIVSGTDTLSKTITYFFTEHYTKENIVVSHFEPPISNTKKQVGADLCEVAKSVRDNNLTKNTVNRIREGKKYLKNQLLSYYTFAGIFNERNNESLLNYSGLICMDIDNIEKPNKLHDKIIDLSLPLVALFKSPSGNGLKAIFKSCSDKSKHRQYFDYYKAILKSKLNIEVDNTGKDLSRACFTSHDPNIYYMNSEFVSEIDLSDYNAELVLDLAHDYIQNSKNGEKHYRLTKISYLLGGYHKGGIIEKETALKKLKQSITERGELDNIEDAFKTIEICFNKGMNEPISKSDMGKFLSYSNEKFESIVNDIAPPIIDNEFKLENIVYPSGLLNKMPKNIQNLVNKVKNENNESLLLYTFLILSSGIFPKVDFSYGSSKLSLNLSNLTIAESASGKSATNLVRELFGDIDKSLEEKEEVEGKKKSLFLSANISGSELFHRISINDGSVIIYDTEISSFTSANSKEWGDYDTLFRQAASNDPISQYRRDSKDVKIDFPRITIYLTGTPSQVTSVFKDKLNGLYSRFLFFSFTGVDTWIQNLIFQKKQDLTKERAYILELYEYFITTPINIDIKEEAQKLLDREFSILFEKYNYDPIIKSVIARHATYAWKLCIIIELYKVFEEKSDKVIVEIETMEIVLEIIFQSLSVATDLSLNLEQVKMTNETRIRKILGQLGLTFSRSEIVELCKDVCKSTTIDKYLKDRRLFKKLEYGKYEIIL